MRFWDSSALVALLVTEEQSGVARQLLRADENVTVWWGTRVECISAIARRFRDSGDETAAQTGRRALALLATSWAEIEPTSSLRSAAERMLTVHPLRAADALQVAAALVWAEGFTAGHQFVCLDGRLRKAAAREGFAVLPS